MFQRITQAVKGAALLDFAGAFGLAMTGAYKASTWTAIVAASGVILSAMYALTLYRRVMFG